MRHLRTPWLAAVTGAAGAVLVFACGSESSTFGGKPEEPKFGEDGSFGSSSGRADVDLLATDPFPRWCGPGSDPVEPPTGTLSCPSDKNLPGCACPTPGATAKCWTGLRRHRNLGVCTDGETKCVQVNETTSTWGPCTGEVLPTPGATEGAAACTCFSEGQWKIENIRPCIVTTCGTSGCTNSAISTVPGDAGTFNCPATFATAPEADWSKNTLKVDCAGHFRLCFRIRKGSIEAPSASDCILGEVCSESDYLEANVVQDWPPLDGWLGADTACATAWASTPEGTSPGYGEMVVKGESVRCDPIDDGSGGELVFNRIAYCPRICTQEPSRPECERCGNGGQGTF